MRHRSTSRPGHDAARAAWMLVAVAATPAGCVDTDLSDELNWSGPLPSLDTNLPARLGDGAEPQPGGGGAPLDDGEDGQGSVVVEDPPEPDETPPWLVAPSSCGPAEVTTGEVCASAGPAGVALRLWASEPVVAVGRADGWEPKAVSDVSSREHHLVLGPLPAETELALFVELEDGAGLTSEAGPFAVATTAERPAVVINEVLLDPLGAEPDQEFVELLNHGDVEISLDGWVLSDEGGEDSLAPPGPLAPGAYALVVAARFLPGEGGDPAPAAGSMVIALEGPIGSSGLRNSGEQLTLRNSDGELVSAYPSVERPPPAGASVERTSPYAPDGDPGNWIPNPWATATPGAVNDVAAGPP